MNLFSFPYITFHLIHLLNKIGAYSISQYYSSIKSIITPILDSCIFCENLSFDWLQVAVGLVAKYNVARGDNKGRHGKMRHFGEGTLEKAQNGGGALEKSQNEML